MRAAPGHHGRNRSRRGFSILELLVVISVIAALAGLLLPALAMLREQQRKVATWDLMLHLGVAVSAYLGDYASLGDAADQTEFARDPWLHLYRIPVANGKPAYIEFSGRQLLRDSSGLGTGPFSPALPDVATHPMDAWHRPFLWQVRNLTVPGSTRSYTTTVRIRSDAGTPDPAYRNDLVFEYTADGKEFTRRSLSTIDGTGEWITAPP